MLQAVQQDRTNLSPPRTDPGKPAGAGTDAADPLPALTGLALPPAAASFLEELLRLEIMAAHAARQFLEQSADRLGEYRTAEELGQALAQRGLLTTYQVDRVLSGTTHGLVLGNYHVLQRLGAGAMGVVFLAEHFLLKRRVAVKVAPVDDDCPEAYLERFYAEMRILADLHHANIVLAYEAGRVPARGPNMPLLLYLVMELVSGGDLEQYVVDHGPVPVAQACDWIRQAACGLQEAHDHHLIHRDIKPSNLLLTGQRQVKLVDFGLARQFCSRLTDPRALLGTLDYMAPEQSHDPSAVGGQADIYGLGASLFWLLTGQAPHPPARTLSAALEALQKGQPRRLRQFRPDAPEELEALLDRMLDRDPDRRPALPLAVRNALTPFATPTASFWEIGPRDFQTATAASAPATDGLAARAVACRGRRVLIVDDEPPIRQFCRLSLETLGCVCAEVGDGETALAVARTEPIDLLLLDRNLPGMDGYEVCRRLRERPPRPHFKIIIMSGCGDQNALAESLPRGADDYLAKPFELRQLEAKVQNALRLKDAQDRTDRLTQDLVQTNRQLENSLTARATDVRRAQDALLFAMAKMAESRDGETAGHLRRLQLYTRCLAKHVADEPSWEGWIDQAFLEQLGRCVPLHDIGKIGLPDAVLLKPGPFQAAERALMETHTLLGAQILEAIGQSHGESLSFLGMATAIVRHHHERYDGRGYPDGLAGDAIPAAARLVAVADVYDALRRRRAHKASLPHAEAAAIILHGSHGQFDPTLVRAFARCQAEFERIYRDIPD